MIIDWTRNLSTEEEKHLFERKFQGAREVLDRLGELIKEREHSMDVYERGLKQFECPNWAEKQSFNNGLRSAFNIIQTLIAHPDQRTDNGPISTTSR